MMQFFFGYCKHHMLIISLYILMILSSLHLFKIKVYSYVDNYSSKINMNFLSNLFKPNPNSFYMFLLIQ